MEDLFGFSEFRRSAPRPILMTAALVAIAALGLSGLYQGFRLTWRDYGPAPSYPQIATAPAAPAAAPIPDPTTEVADNDAPRPAPAANDDAPASPAPAMPPPATDVAALTPAATTPPPAQAVPAPVAPASADTAPTDPRDQPPA
jgi:hypothetical protein